MFDKVMVGIDQETHGRDAIALARQLVSRDGELTFAHIHGGFPIYAKGASDDFLNIEQNRARELVTEVVDESQVAARVRSIGSPSVGQGLHQLAEADGSDLLVIGSTRLGIVGRIRTGDMTCPALNGAPCAIAIAPAAYADQPTTWREIGVAFDDSVESRDALDVGRHLASERHATLSAFTAVSIPTKVRLGQGLPSDTTIEDLVDHARRRIESLGGVEAHAAYGDAAEELTVYSASVDLLVVGSRGYGPIGRLVHGSTTHRLLATARSPLLSITRSARARVAHDSTDSTTLVTA